MSDTSMELDPIPNEEMKENMELDTSPDIEEIERKRLRRLDACCCTTRADMAAWVGASALGQMFFGRQSDFLARLIADFAGPSGVNIGAWVDAMEGELHDGTVRLRWTRHRGLLELNYEGATGVVNVVKELAYLPSPCPAVSPPLVTLDLGGNAVGAAGATALADAFCQCDGSHGNGAALSACQELYLDCNSMGDEGMAALATCFFPSCKHARRRRTHCRGGGDGEHQQAAATCSACDSDHEEYEEKHDHSPVSDDSHDSSSNESHLHDDESHHSDEDPAPTTATVNPLPSLCQLHLEGNAIGDKGVGSLCAACLGQLADDAGVPPPKLQALYLNDNSIGDEGADELAACLCRAGALPRLRTLVLAGNPTIGEESKEVLRAAAEARGLDLTI